MDNVVSTANYYPFGMKMDAASYDHMDREKQRYGYNGNEEIEGGGLSLMDFNARIYNPPLGRFMGSDALASMTAASTPYNFTANNPINFTDPSGYQMVSKRQAAYRNDDGSNQSFGGGSGSSMAWQWGRTGSGSGFHWTDVYSTMTSDFFLMSGYDFESKHGIGVSQFNDILNGKNDVKLGKKGQLLFWNEYGGKEITRKEWLLGGGDGEKKADLYFSGGWQSVAFSGGLYPTIMGPFDGIMGIITGEDRHFLGADAIALTLSLNASGGVNMGAEIGALVVLRGVEAGVYLLGDLSIGGGTVDVSLTMEFTYLYYSGSADLIMKNTFLEERWEGNLGVGAIVTGNLNVLYSRRESGEYVIGYGGGMGVGASATIISGNINRGGSGSSVNQITESFKYGLGLE